MTRLILKGFFAVSVLSSCGVSQQKADFSDNFIWAGYPQASGITRSNGNKYLSCSDESFSDYACLPYSDLELLGRELSQCRRERANK